MTLNENSTPTRTVAIGDIHGCDVALDTLLNELNMQKDDQLVILGDAVDRGPETRRVLDLLLEVAEFTNLAFIMGNHEEMMLAALESKSQSRRWKQFGGKEALDSYGGDPNNIPPWHLELIAKGLAFYTTETEIFVHAKLQPGVSLEDQSTSWLRWERIDGSEQPWPDGRRVICGHTPQTSGLPYVNNNWICIDTLAYGGGALTALDVTNDLVYQAQQSGSFRGGIPLADL